MKRRLTISNDDYIIFGICGGIGEYFSIDSNIIRLLFIVFTIIFKWGIILYIIAFLIIPGK